MSLTTNKRWVIGLIITNIVSLVVCFYGSKVYSSQEISVLNTRLDTTNNELVVCQNNRVNIGMNGESYSGGVGINCINNGGDLGCAGIAE